MRQVAKQKNQILVIWILRHIFLTQKIFSTFFKILEHFTLPYVVVFMGRKKFFQKPEPNIIDREKIF